MSTTCPDTTRRQARPISRPRVQPQRDGASAGFTLISVLFILVVLAALGAAIAAISVRQQMGSAGEIDAARALQSARAGLEWAAFQVLRNPPLPAAAPGCFATSSFALAGLSDFTVTVSCSRTPSTGTLADGSTTMVFYQLLATACNVPAGGACPNPGTPSTSYVERQLSWTLMR